MKMVKSPILYFFVTPETQGPKTIVPNLANSGLLEFKDFSPLKRTLQKVGLRKPHPRD